MKHGRTAVWPAMLVTFAEAASNVGSRPNTTDTQRQTDRQTERERERERETTQCEYRSSV